MRLLLRGNSHNRVNESTVEIAAAPDTPGRERWQWHVRLHDRFPVLDDVAVGMSVVRSDGTELLLEVSADGDVARAEAEQLEVSSRAAVRRTPDDLLLLLVHRGAALVEQRHLLAELDVMVLEGDDPLEISVDAADGPLGLSIVRLHPALSRPLAWVP